MTVFTAEQIGMAAWNAGFGRDEPTLARAIAVALGESSGNTAAYNGNKDTGDKSYGLWQINMLGTMGPERRKAFGIAKNEELFDPQKNANAAWVISNHGRNWTPWSAFKSGTYLTHMTVAHAAAQKLISQAGKNREGLVWKLPFVEGAANAGDAIGGAVGTAKDNVTGALDVGGAIQNAANSLTQTIFKAGLNFGTVIVAVILLILGVIVLLRSPLKKAAAGVTGVAADVIPGGKVATTFAKAGTQKLANQAARVNAAAKLAKARDAAAKVAAK